VILTLTQFALPSSEQIIDLSLLPLAQNDEPQGSISPVRSLGKGTFGTVDKVVDSNGRNFARKTLKTIKKNEKDSQEPCADHSSIFREMAVLSTLQGHPNVVRCFSFDLKPAEDRFEILMELMDGDLDSFLKDSDREHRMLHFKSIAHQILCGIACLHSEGFAHRDIKTANILYRKTGKGIEIKVHSPVVFFCCFYHPLPLSRQLSDFGLARRLRGPAYTGNMVSLFYRPPELLFLPSNEDDVDSLEYGTEIDVWSAGVVLSEIFLGFHPLAAADVASFKDRMGWIFDLSCHGRTHRASYEPPRFGISGLVKAHHQGPVDPSLLELLDGLVEPDPKKRMTAQTALGHAFFRGHVPASSDVFAHRPRYLPPNTTDWTVRHRRIVQNTRCTTVFNMRILCDHLCFDPETLSQAVEYMDAFMTETTRIVDGPEELDLVGSACLMLSAFMNQISPYEESEYVLDGDPFTGEQVLAKVYEIFDCLNHLLPKSRLPASVIKNSTPENLDLVANKYGGEFPTLDLHLYS
jgi:serine/threonine protein kinase